MRYVFFRKKNSISDDLALYYSSIANRVPKLHLENSIRRCGLSWLLAPVFFTYGYHFIYTYTDTVIMF